MPEVSVTVTVGEGSESHNHDLEYRSTLNHVHDRPNGVVELIPYRDYHKVIDEAMRPYIDQYNQRVEERYQAAWERYNAGEIKTKPRNRDYQKMGESYTSETQGEKQRNPHTGKVEEVPLFRSIIVGIGDKEDRVSGRISEEQAKAIFQKVTDRFQERFPAFLLLGASLHLDEQGFYHAHLDYKPMYEKATPDAEKGGKRRGLDVGIGHDAALEHMGFKPEQSIINGRDKAPLLFNAFRNEIYRMMESAMAEQGLRLQYGVTARKDPEKNSRRNQKLDAWQATQDAARDLQHQKNVALEVLSQDTVSPEGYKSAVMAVQRLQYSIDEVKSSPMTVTRNGYKIRFGLFDQLQSVLKHLQETLLHLIHKVESLTKERDLYKPYKTKYEKLETQHKELQRDFVTLRQGARNLMKENDDLKDKHKAKDQLLAVGEYAGRNLLEIYQEIEARAEKRKEAEAEASRPRSRRNEQER